jgi:disulfide bond formation protein DsbB
MSGQGVLRRAVCPIRQADWLRKGIAVKLGGMTNAILRGSFRIQFLIGFLACAGLLGFAFYLQLHDGLEPCPLCIFQRVAFFVMGLVFLLGALHAPKGTGGRRGYGVAALLAALGGIAVAGNHVRLQHLPPDQVPSCGPGLDYMLEAMPITGVIRKVMTGSGECANVDWSFLGLSMPTWSLVWFVLLAIWAGYAAFRRR